MQIDGGVFQIRVTEQNLDGTQIGTAFEQMCGPAMAQRVWRHRLIDTGTFRRSADRVPNGFGGDRVVSAATPQPAGK